MDFVANIKTKYPHLSAADATDIVAKAKMFYYGLQYPCEPYADEETRPIKGFKDEQWILSACDELIERLGFNSAIGYKENGVSWTFDGAGLSNRLCELIKPIVGTF